MPGESASLLEHAVLTQTAANTENAAKLLH
jgi:hypothetical protein